MRTVDPLAPGTRLQTGLRRRTCASWPRRSTTCSSGWRTSAATAPGAPSRAQEAERRRLARELHDELGQSLTGVLLQIDEAIRTPEAADLEEAREGARRSLEDVRRIARNLRPDTLVELGLASALNALATRFTRQSGVPVDRRLEADLPALGEDVEVVLYRVAQEALTNVARHADARQVTLELAHADGTVTLTVDDDGRGIPPYVGDEARGITGMRERALLVHGRLQDRARPDAGNPRAPGGPGRMTTPVKASVLVADDHAVVRHGVRGILAAQPDFEVIAEAADGAEAVEMALALRPHLVILDVSMPRLTGLQAAGELGRRAPGIRLLMLSMHDDEQYFFEALRAGASGYVLKSGVDRDLVAACRAAMRGESFLYPDAAAALIKDRLARGAAGEAVPTTRSRHARPRCSSSSPRRTRTSRSPSCWSSAPRPSRTTAPGSSRSSGCAIASSSPATRSAGAWFSPSLLTDDR